MLIGGEKYACEACVRGHRVSNCQHADRQLTHIARKGRPVSQCTHCRTLRKSRSAHVKCDCGEKSHLKGACTHSKEMDSKADTCCCSHGGRCACALKKEHLDPVPESDSDERSSATSPNEARRPRAHTIQSEGTCLTVFTNGYHKPAVKHNQMAHKSGLPYVVPRAHSIHGSPPGGLANRSVDNLPHTSTIDALHSDSHIKDSMVSAQQQQRLVKSEHNSPILSSSNFDQLNGQLPQLDLSFSSNDFNVPVSFDGFPAVSDIEQPIFSAGLSAGSVDWSHYDGLGFNASFASFSQPPSFTGLDFGSADQPALTTTSTSGEISEAEDLGPIADVNQTRPGLVRQYGSDLENSELGDHDGYRLSTASSHIGMPQVQMLASSDIGSLDIDEFLKGVVPTNHYDSNVAVSTNVPATFGEDQKFETSFDDSSYPLGEVEDDGLWIGDFPSSNMVPNNRAGGASELNGWAQ